MLGMTNTAGRNDRYSRVLVTRALLSPRNCHPERSRKVFSSVALRAGFLDYARNDRYSRVLVTRAPLSPRTCHPERSRRVYSSAAHSERQTPDAKPSGVPFLLFCFRGSSAVYAVMITLFRRVGIIICGCSDCRDSNIRGFLATDMERPIRLRRCRNIEQI